jgi:hypothetical protein
VENLAEATIRRGSWIHEEEHRVREPHGISVPAVSLQREQLPSDLVRASIRHAFAHEFANRLHQAFGVSGTAMLFKEGWLYGPNGRPIGLSVGGNGIWNKDGRRLANVYSSGRILDRENKGVVGFLSGGVVLDETGRALAATEMATGTGLPDEFLQQTVTKDVAYMVESGGPGSPLEDGQLIELPGGTGIWSDVSLLERLEP